MKFTSIRKLELIANSIRHDVIKMLSEAGSGHSAGSLGMADMLTALYFNVLKHNPKNPRWKERDYFVLSNGHICPALYAVLANAGYFPKNELMTLRKLGTRLQGHPYRLSVPGLETSSGPLGCGLSQAAGMALGLKMDRKNNHVYCLTSDGEHDEGNTWEAVMFIAKNKLDNITAILDRNYIQISGNTEDIMPLDPIKQKYLAFNWNVIEINGNNMKQIVDALHRAGKMKKPTMVIAKNVPGKGVSFMENKHEWHGKAPTKDQAKIALIELKEIRKKLARK
jgi:transketolase